MSSTPSDKVQYALCNKLGACRVVPKSDKGQSILQAYWQSSVSRGPTVIRVYFVLDGKSLAFVAEIGHSMLWLELRFRLLSNKF